MAWRGHEASPPASPPRAGYEQAGQDGLDDLAVAALATLRAAEANAFEAEVAKRKAAEAAVAPEEPPAKSTVEPPKPTEEPPKPKVEPAAPAPVEDDSALHEIVLVGRSDCCNDLFHPCVATLVCDDG